MMTRNFHGALDAPPARRYQICELRLREQDGRRWVEMEAQAARRSSAPRQARQTTHGDFPKAAKTQGATPPAGETQRYFRARRRA